MRNLSLLQRGLLLVSFPIICQLIFIYVLCNSLWEMESYVDQEFQRRELARRVSKMSLELLDVLNFMRSNSGGDQLGENGPLRSDYSKLVGEFDAILGECRHDPDKFSKALIFSQALNQVDDLLNWAASKRAEGSAQWSEAHLEFSLKLVVRAKALIDANSSFLDSLESEDAYNFSTVQAERKIGLILFFGLTLSVAAAVLLGIFYAFGIKRPLAHVAQNSALMSERKPLLPVLKGQGEVKTIDYLVHLVDRAIAESIASEEAMVENAGDLICSLDDQFRFVSANAYVQTMLERTPEELKGHHVHELMPPEQGLYAEECLRRTLTRQEVQVFELSLLRKTEELLETRWSCFWVASEQRIIAVVNDISEQKQIDRIKRDFEEVIGDELRQPLVSILAQARSLQAQDKALPGSAVQELAHVERSLDKLISLIDEFVDMQQLDTTSIVLECTMSSFCALEQEAYDLIKSFASAKRIEVVLSQSQIEVYCDKAKIVRVLVNLLSNAIKFSAEGSVVRVLACREDNFLTVSVVDQGPGIEEKFRSALFEPFAQSDSRARSGTGLGLAICKLIVEAHGGSIAVRSPASSNAGTGAPAAKGSEFFFLLPIKIDSEGRQT